MKTTLKLAFLGTVLAVAASSVMASGLKTQDSAEMKITMDVPPMVAITAPEDIDLYFDGQSSVNATRNFCIASNIESPARLVITDNKQNVTQPLFSLTSGKTGDHRAIPFNVSYKSTKAGTNQASTEVTYGKPVDAFGAEWLQTCENNSEAGSSINIKIDKKDAQNVYSDLYSTTLTLTVTPE